jgi:hypothetical protein
VTSDFAFNAEGRDLKGRMFCDSDWGPEKKMPGVILVPAAAGDGGMEKLAKRLGELKFAAILLDEPLPAGPKGLRTLKRAMFFAQMRDEVRTDEICALGVGSGADVVLAAASESKMLAAAVALYPGSPAPAETAAAAVIPTLLVLRPGAGTAGETGSQAVTLIVEAAEAGGAGSEEFFRGALELIRKHTYEKPVVEKPYIPAVTDYMGM